MRKILSIILSLLICFNSMFVANIWAEGGQQQEPELENSFTASVNADGDIVVTIPEELRSNNFVYQGIRIKQINDELVDVYLSIPSSGNNNENYCLEYRDNDLVYTAQKQKDVQLWNDNVAHYLKTNDVLSISLLWGYPVGGNTFYEEYDLGKVELTNANGEYNFKDHFVASFIPSSGNGQDYQEPVIRIDSIDEFGDGILELLINANKDSNSHDNYYVLVNSLDAKDEVINKEPTRVNNGVYSDNGSIKVDDTIKLFTDAGTNRKYVTISKRRIYGLESDNISLAIRVKGYVCTNDFVKINVHEDTSVIPNDLSFTADVINGKNVFTLSGTDDYTFFNEIQVELSKEETYNPPVGDERERTVNVNLQRNLFLDWHEQLNEKELITLTSDPDKTVSIPKGIYEYKILYNNNVVKTGSIELKADNNNQELKVEQQYNESTKKYDVVLSFDDSSMINKINNLNINYMSGNSFANIQFGKYEDLSNNVKAINTVINSGKIILDYDTYFSGAQNGYYDVGYSINDEYMEQVQGCDLHYSQVYCWNNVFPYLDRLSNKLCYPNFNTTVEKGVQLKDLADKLPQGWEIRYGGTYDTTPKTRITDETKVEVQYKENPDFPINETEQFDNEFDIRKEVVGDDTYYVTMVIFRTGETWNSVADDAETLFVSDSKAYLKGTQKEIEKYYFNSWFEAAVDYLNKDSSGTIKLLSNITLNSDAELYHRFSNYDYTDQEVTDCLTIDLNGYTLDLQDNQLILNSENTTNIVYIKNGTIKGSGNSLINFKKNNNKVYIENVDIINESQNHESTAIEGHAGELYIVCDTSIVSNGYGIHLSKYLRYREWDGNYQYEGMSINGTLDIHSYNDCIRYDDSDDFDYGYQCYAGNVNIGQYEGNIVSNLVSDDGYALYIDNKNNGYLGLYNVKISSKKGIYIDENNNLDIYRSNLNVKDGPAIILNGQKQTNLYICNSSIYTNSSVIKDISGNSNPEYFVFFQGNSVFQENNINPFEIGFDNFSEEYSLFNNDVKDYIHEELQYGKFQKDVFRNLFDPEEQFVFDEYDEMYFAYTEYAEDDDSSSFRTVRNAQEFIKAVGESSVSYIEFSRDLQGTTIDFANADVNVNHQLNIELNGVNLNNVHFNVEPLNENSSVQLFISGNGGYIKNHDTVFSIFGAGVDFYNVEIRNEEGYIIEATYSQFISMNGGSKLIGDKGVHLIESMESNFCMYENSTLTVNDLALMVEQNNVFYSYFQKGTKITSENDAIVIKSRSNNDMQSCIDFGGEIKAEGRAISVLNAEVNIYIGNGKIEGKNALYLKTSLFHPFSIEVYGGKLIGKEATVIQEGAFASGQCLDNAYLYIKGGKFKCGENFEIFDCKVLSKVKVYGGLFSKDIGPTFAFKKYNIDKTNVYDYKVMQIQDTGDYKYAMVRGLLNGKTGNIEYNIMDAISVDKTVEVDADNLVSIVSDEATAGENNVSVVMKVDTQDDENAIEQIDVDEDKEVLGYYDIGIGRISGGNSKNITETSQFQIVSIEAGDVDQETFTIIHKHEGEEAVEIAKVSKAQAQEYMNNPTSAPDSFFYFDYDVDLEIDMIRIVTRKFSTFVFAQAKVYDAASCEAPLRKLGLVANGQPQELIEACANVKGGTVVYSLSKDGVFSEEIPTGVLAMEYTVYYKVIGDAKHSDSTVRSIKVSIKEGNNSKNVPSSFKIVGTGVDY